MTVVEFRFICDVCKQTFDREELVSAVAGYPSTDAEGAYYEERLDLCHDCETNYRLKLAGMLTTGRARALEASFRPKPAPNQY